MGERGLEIHVEGAVQVRVPVQVDAADPVSARPQGAAAVQEQAVEAGRVIGLGGQPDPVESFLVDVQETEAFVGAVPDAFPDRVEFEVEDMVGGDAAVFRMVGQEPGMTQVGMGEEDEAVVAAGQPVVAVVVLPDDEHVVLRQPAVLLEGIDVHGFLPGPADAKAFAQNPHQQVSVPVFVAAGNDIGAAFDDGEEVVHGDRFRGDLVDAAHERAHPQGAVPVHQDVVHVVGVEGLPGPPLRQMAEFPVPGEMVDSLGGADQDVAGRIGGEAGHMVVGEGSRVVLVMQESGQRMGTDVIAE